MKMHKFSYQVSMNELALMVDSSRDERKIPVELAGLGFADLDILAKREVGSKVLSA